MKRTQLVMLIVVLVGVVGGIAFVKPWFAGAPVTQEPIAEIKDVSTQAYFPVMLATLETDVEVSKPGRFDFPFENRRPDSLTLGLDKKGCTCETVEVLLLTPEESAKWPALPPDKKGKPDDLPEAELKKFPKPPAEPARWVNLEEARPLVLPPGTRGWARLVWATKTIKPVRLRAALWMQTQGRDDTRGDTILEVLANVVPAIQVNPGEVAIADIRPGQGQTTEFWCWSTTRPALTLKVQPEFPTPCIEATLKQLTESECRDLEKRVEKDTETKTRVRCAYKATVQLHDRAGDAELELGSLDRNIFFLDADGSKALGVVKGVVRGDVRLVNPQHEDLIHLGRFRHDLGTARKIPIETTQPGLEVALDSWSPAFLKVTLSKDPEEPDRWILEVKVPPNTASGILPRDSKVVLKSTKGTPPRRFQIPVVGNALRSR